MVTVARTDRAHPSTTLWVFGALAVAGLLIAALLLLAVALRSNPVPSLDRTVMDWITGWSVPGLYGFFTGVSAFTQNWPAMVLGVMALLLLLSLGRKRQALALALAGCGVGLAALSGDAALEAFVARSRPVPGISSVPSFPSGHVLGSTVFFGFVAFLAVRAGLRKRVLAPVVLLLASFVLAAGVSRIYLQHHWPSDIAAGYLLGVLGLMALVGFFLYLGRKGWLLSGLESLAVSSQPCQDCRTEVSLASVVVLDPTRRTATKVYRPPVLVRVLYWLAFQAPFPYDRNRFALEAAAHRRRIAGLLTRHRFGRDLVAGVDGVVAQQGRYAFVTELIPGEKVDNSQEIQDFLRDVTELFSQAGLGTWQVNPRNPHAHTNLIRTPAGDLKIIDLESALVTPFAPHGQWGSTLRRGAFPIFDDIDFERLKAYVVANTQSLGETLGPRRYGELLEGIAGAELAILRWKGAEPRVWSRLARRGYWGFRWAKRALRRASGPPAPVGPSGPPPDSDVDPASEAIASAMHRVFQATIVSRSKRGGPGSATPSR